MNAPPQTQGLWCLGILILVSACSTKTANRAGNSQTLYLRPQGAEAAARISAPKPRGATSTKPPQGLAPFSPTPLTSTKTRTRDVSVPGADAFSTLQAVLLKRIEALPNDRADSICLTLEIIPHDRIFDRGIDPRNALAHYTKSVTSINQLRDIEEAINNPRK